MGPITKKSKIRMHRKFLNTLYYNLAKFQVSRTFLSWLLFENVKSQISRFKVPGPIFGKNRALFGHFFPKSKKSGRFLGFECSSQWSYMKKHQKPFLNCIFGENISHFDPFWAHFLYGKILRKRAISVIPGRTRTRLSRA